ncbi:MAG: TonB-dependent receptor domain-containing protein [Gemmatimonadota bacterium]
MRRAFETRLPAVGTAWIEPVLGIDHADGETSWSPELGAWLRPTRATRVYGRLGRGFRLPTFGDLYFGAAPGVRANPDLRSERITLDAEVGVEAGLPIGPALGTVRVAGYARHTDRPIVWLASSVALWSPQNLDRLSSRGMEIEIGFETDAEARHGLRLDAGFTLQRSRVGFAANRNPLPYQPDRAGRVGLEGRRGPLALRLAARFTGSRTTSIAGTRRLPAFTVIDAAVRRGIDVGSLALGLSARLDNLFDHRYELIELFPEPGRQLTISLHIR